MATINGDADNTTNTHLCQTNTGKHEGTPPGAALIISLASNSESTRNPVSAPRNSRIADFGLFPTPQEQA